MGKDNLKNQKQCAILGYVVNFLCGVGIENVDVVDLETAKYIKKLGFNKPTHWYWQDKTLPFLEKGLKRVKINKKRMNHNKYDEWIYSAPTREEFLCWINSFITIENNYLNVYFEDVKISCELRKEDINEQNINKLIYYDFYMKIITYEYNKLRKEYINKTNIDDLVYYDLYMKRFSHEHIQLIKSRKTLGNKL